MICYCVGLGSLFWVVIAEIFPLQIRGLAMSVVSAANTFANLLVTLTFLKLISGYGLTGAYCLYAFISFLACIFIYLKMPETKGVSLETIEMNVRSGTLHELRKL
jgi:MFS family permease